MNSKFLVCFLIFFLVFPISTELFAAENPNIRVDDPSFMRENLRTGETVNDQGALSSIIINSLGAILIVLFIVIYAIKKRAKRDDK